MRREFYKFRVGARVPGYFFFSKHYDIIRSAYLKLRLEEHLAILAMDQDSNWWKWNFDKILASSCRNDWAKNNPQLFPNGDADLDLRQPLPMIHYQPVSRTIPVPYAPQQLAFGDGDHFQHLANGPFCDMRCFADDMPKYSSEENNDAPYVSLINCCASIDTTGMYKLKPLSSRQYYEQKDSLLIKMLIKNLGASCSE